MLCCVTYFDCLQNIHLASFLVYKVPVKICHKRFWILYHQRFLFVGGGDEMFNFRAMICCRVLQRGTKKDEKTYKLMLRCVWILGTGMRNTEAYNTFMDSSTIDTMCSVSGLWGRFPKTDRLTASYVISGFMCDVNEIFVLLGCCTLLNCSSMLMFQDIALVLWS